MLLVKNDAGWSFDPDKARDEILSRRIGLKELDIIEIMRRSIEVQAGFRSVDLDGDRVMEFASSVQSGPGQRDGLYWPQEDGKPNSPVGIEIAMAAADDVSVEGVDQDPNPYLGYDFRILTNRARMRRAVPTITWSTGLCCTNRLMAEAALSPDCLIPRLQ